jgi:CheY-like chemotaxis protein
MYQKLLSNHGYSVHTAMDGEDGLKKAFQEHPDLILLDIRMPKMDGMTMLNLLRKDSWGAQVPVIILTNLDTDDEILKGVVKHHPAYYLIKSNVEHSQVLEKIKSILETPKQ